MPQTLHHVEYNSAGEGAPVLVMLHGFGGDHHAFFGYYRRLSKHFRVIGFDLPGHGGSVHLGEGGNTRLSAEMVWSALDEMEIGRICLCGHSLGGAVASLMALGQAERVKALTLIAPGGFGHEINAKPLFRFARAREGEEIRAVIEQFYGFRYQVPDNVVEALEKARQSDELCQSLERIATALFGSGEQGRLPRDELFALNIPTKVLWGTQDNITPTRQAHKLPGHVAAHVFDGVGHMVHEEVPETVIRLLISHTGR